ncbi:substrate-binding periplasmic protein [Sinomonas mesophila]|uniref:substrate-binding periplasmic protein n=1 Tax=Sinomonas mesophila TaxID=1531955 RepID=UPI000987BD95|nr:transporter substrate-binding domain-containing protein [Sinomonas mesophila]
MLKSIGRAWAAVPVCIVLLGTGCGISVPADPDGTLDRVRGGVLRVGVTENPGFVELPGDGDPQGTEPELVREFAAVVGAEVTWVEGSERELVEGLKDGELDAAVGGFRDDSPWQQKAGMTRPYGETVDEHGATAKHVLFVPEGENAFLLELDRFLQDRKQG